ncbi:hypothetical protein SAMN05444167_2451 [Terriglobus roseus]|uniref:Uncharacterized protein n=1 Tax=Terriglobus roseus TaxID=392734 RepID=A0A1G7L6E9_9BACT|nr:hypothetical protein SAMN05444167_2451 [Terriglobus roseus]
MPIKYSESETLEQFQKLSSVPNPDLPVAKLIEDQ